MLNHNYLYDTINKKVITVNSNNILFVCYVSAVLVGGNFRGHVDLKLSCYIVYLQTTGVKYCY